MGEGLPRKESLTLKEKEDLISTLITNPTIITAFRSSSDREVACNAIAEVLGKMVVEGQIKKIDPKTFSTITRAIFQRLSSN